METIADVVLVRTIVLVTVRTLPSDSVLKETEPPSEAAAVAEAPEDGGTEPSEGGAEPSDGGGMSTMAMLSRAT